jgi:hypothetical protein
MIAHAQPQPQQITRQAVCPPSTYFFSYCQRCTISPFTSRSPMYGQSEISGSTCQSTACLSISNASVWCCSDGRVPGMIMLRMARPHDPTG